MVLRTDYYPKQCSPYLTGRALVLEVLWWRRRTTLIMLSGMPSPDLLWVLCIGVAVLGSYPLRKALVALLCIGKA